MNFVLTYRDQNRLAEVDELLEQVRELHLAVQDGLGGAARARSLYWRAAQLLAGAGDLRSEALFVAFLGALEADSGRLEESDGYLDAAAHVLVGIGDPVSMAVLDLCCGLGDLGRYRRAPDRGSRERALSEAKQRVSRARSYAKAVAETIDVSYALELLENGIEQLYR